MESPTASEDRVETAVPRQEPVSRKKPRDTRRAQLFEATIQTLARRGYARMTLGDVARAAGISSGLVNFHFESKERLLAETLEYLSDEFRHAWEAALAASAPHPAARLDAMLRSSFDPAIFAPSRLAAWCAFWGEAQSRPLYQTLCGTKDAAHSEEIERLCAELVARDEGTGNPVRIARVLSVTVDGVWQDMVTMAEPYSREEGLKTVFTCAAAFFPSHFDEDGHVGGAR
jgi:TetR/AcrR family transcriptional repressor of bet genes